MGAAQLSVKGVVKNIDDYLLQPLGEAFYAFNMQFDFDPDGNGDLEVKARGTESLMKNEVRSQRLLQLLNIAGNPNLASFVKFPVVCANWRKRWTWMQRSLSMMSERRSAKLRLSRAAGGDNQPQQQQAPGMSPMDMSGGGGGNIGVGGAAVPGEQGFGAAQTPAEQPSGDAQAQLASLLGGLQ